MHSYLSSLWGCLTLLVLAGTTLPAPAGAACEEVIPLDLLPGDQVCATWVQDGDPLTAYDQQQLTEIINGGAFLYIQYGFVAAVFQNYIGEVSGEPASGMISLYNQGSAANARALYLDPESGFGDPILDWQWSGEARINYGIGNITLQFWEECFFGAVLIMTDGDEPVQSARCLAEAVCVMIHDALPVQHGSWGLLKTRFK